MSNFENVTGVFQRNAHPDLSNAWIDWCDVREGREPREARDVAMTFVEILGRELAFLAMSTCSTPPPKRFFKDLRNRDQRDFGTEQFILRYFKKIPPLSKVLSKYPADSLQLPSISDVLQRTRRYICGEQEAIRSRGKSSGETWFDAFVAFNGFRNLAKHEAYYDCTLEAQAHAYPDKCMAGRVATEVWIKDTDLIGFVADCLSPWTTWLADAACDVIRSYRIATFVVDGSGSKLRFNGGRAPDLPLTRTDERAVPPATWYVASESTPSVAPFPGIRDRKQVEAFLQRWVESAPPQPNRMSELWEAARDGKLVPVIGPDFGLPSSPTAVGAAHVIARASEAMGGKYAEIDQFLKILVSKRLRMDSPSYLHAPSDRSPEARLVGELALIAAKATALYGRALASATIPLESRQPVPLDAEHRSLSEAMKRLAGCFRGHSGDTIESLASEFRDRDHLGVDAMARDLREVAAEITDSVELSASQIEWLTDLVWHALRFDAPFYPDSESLAVQIALCANATCPRVHSPASSGPALILNPRDCATYLRKWLDRMNERVEKAQHSPGATDYDPHRTLVRAMKRCLDRRNNPPGLQPWERINEPVFLIDTSFDQRMAIALKAADLPWAVVFPIDVDPPQKTRDDPAWAVRSFPDGECGFLPAEKSQDLPVGNRGLIGDLERRIVLVKPFGAPLEDLQPFEAILNADRRRSEWQQVLPRLLSDDVSILHDLVRRDDSLPPDLRGELHGAGSAQHKVDWDLFFLGYSLEEHGRRVRIVADVQPTDDDTSMQSKLKVHYISDPIPTGLHAAYLNRARFKVGPKGLTKSMRNLEEWLDFADYDVKKPS